MVGTASTQRFFKKPDQDEWHAYRDDGTTALCGQSQLTYNVDQISDTLPNGATLHSGCRQALDQTEQAPGAVAPEGPTTDSPATDSIDEGPSDDGSTGSEDENPSSPTPEDTTSDDSGTADGGSEDDQKPQEI